MPKYDAEKWKTIDTLDKTQFQFVLVADADNGTVRTLCWEPRLQAWCKTWPLMVPNDDPSFETATHWMEIPDCPTTLHQIQAQTKRTKE